MHIITFRHQRLAQIFADYMATKAINIRIDVLQDGYHLSCDNAADLSMIEQELNRYLENPTHPRYVAASWQTGQIIKGQPTSLFSHFSWHDLKKKTGIFTLSIVILTVLFYLFSQMMGYEQTLYWFGFPYDAFEGGQIWRWLTPIFIHFTLLHITMNLFWWWYLGSMVETRISVGKLLELTILSGLIANYCEAWLVGPNFGGLSGVVYALIGYVWWLGFRRPQFGLFLPNMMMVLAVIWLLAGFTGYFGPIANTAHLVGLLVGLLIALKDTVIMPLKLKKDAQHVNDK